MRRLHPKPIRDLIHCGRADGAVEPRRLPVHPIHELALFSSNGPLYLQVDRDSGRDDIGRMRQPVCLSDNIFPPSCVVRP